MISPPFRNRESPRTGVLVHRRALCLRGVLTTAVLCTTAQACVAAATGDVPFTPRMNGSPPIRIGVRVNVGEVRLRANRGLLLRPEGRGSAVRVAGEVTARRSAGGFGLSGHSDLQGLVRLTVEAAERGEFVSVDGVSYRGTIELVSGERGITAINIADIEEYLLSVVGSELWSRSAVDLAALRAQAVAARTYALKNAGRYRADGYDLLADVTDQAYRGVLSENGAASRAVRDTRGQVIVYGGELISAFYHSTCGRVTASTEEAFRTVRPQPYLQPVSDARSDSGYYNDISPHFVWRVEWTGEVLHRVFRRTLPEVLGVDQNTITSIEDITTYRTGPSGRVVELRVKVADGVIPVFGPDIRAALQTPDGENLKSTDFTLDVERRDGVVTHVTASGWGLGHGVGLCQWGAVGRARAGQDYRTIIRTYYRGAVVERWY